MNVGNTLVIPTVSCIKWRLPRGQKASKKKSPSSYLNLILSKMDHLVIVQFCNPFWAYWRPPMSCLLSATTFSCTPPPRPNFAVSPLSFLPPSGIAAKVDALALSSSSPFLQSDRLHFCTTAAAASADRMRQNSFHSSPPQFLKVNTRGDSLK